jgi:hypothetical protein
MTNTINAAVNPAMANNLIEQALAEKPVEQPVKIVPPSDTVVNLPCGYITDAGEVITEAEVRELNGNDEEAIARATNPGKAMLTILQRGTVRIGNEKATEKMLDQMLSGDRDMLILGIFKATFGNVSDIAAFCYKCEEDKIVSVELDKDIKVKVLTDPVNDRVFTVKGKTNTYTVKLPNGIAQKEMMLNPDKTGAELSTIMLENTVAQINNSPVLSKLQIQNLGLVDRRKLVEEINKRIAGPQFDTLTVTCPDCESEVSVSVNFGTLFQF